MRDDATRERRGSSSPRPWLRTVVGPWLAVSGCFADLGGGGGGTDETSETSDTTATATDPTATGSTSTGADSLVTSNTDTSNTSGVMTDGVTTDSTHGTDTTGDATTEPETSETTAADPCRSCDENATCTNGFCACTMGYEGDGQTCTDIDGCAAQPCFPGVGCMDAPAPETGFQCGECPKDHIGDGITCKEIHSHLVDASGTTATLGPYFRSNGYVAAANGTLVDFEARLDLTSTCNIDFYVFEGADPTAPLTQLWRKTNVFPATAGYKSSGPINLPIQAGKYYVLAAAWNCTATYYYNVVAADYNAGFGIFKNSRWDNAYPGPSDAYAPPNTGGGTTAYAQLLRWTK